MVASKAKDRLSPPLAYIFRASHAARDAKKRIDLRDRGGERVLAVRRTTARSAITEPVLRHNVSLDLEKLMNSVNFESSQALGDLTFVRRSILNYGLPDVVHRTIDEADLKSIADEILEALLAYEPRLAPKSLEVNRDDDLDIVELQIRFFIRADLICDPVAVPVTFVADLQFETSVFAIRAT